MIRFLNSSQLLTHPKLKHSMHKDRAIQFSTRLRWEVTVNNEGEEYDEYDNLNPLYVVIENFDGEHAGSLRYLPTTGRTMVNDHFMDLTDGVRIQSPHIWECTRFCISPTADRRVATQLLAAGAFLMQECCIDHFVGVFDEKMERVYRAIGASPNVLGRKQTKSGHIGVGLWEFDLENYQRLLRKARLSECELSWAFEAKSFDNNILNSSLANSEMGAAAVMASMNA